MTLAARRVDRTIVKEVQTTYRDVPIQPGDVVLDLGANIGAAARLFLEMGAKRVIAVEPDPTNYRLARKNLAKRPAKLLWGAVGAEAGRMPFYLRPDKPFLSSVMSDKGRPAIQVPCLAFARLLAEYRPAIVKCDIEFGEYALPDLYVLPAFVRVIAIELHVRYDLVFAERRQSDAELRAQREQTAALMASFVAQGFREVRRTEKQAKDRKVEDKTGLGPLVRSVDGIWARVA